MSTQTMKNPGRRLLGFVLVMALACGALLTAVLTGRTSAAPGLALDLEGGTQIILTPTTTDGSAISDEDIEQAISIIRQRVDASGVAEAQISRQGGQNIVVAIPGQPDASTLDLVRNSAVLYFRPVLRIIQGSAAQIAESQNQYQAQRAAASAQPSDGASEAPSATPAQTVTAEQVATQLSDIDGDGTISTTALPSTSDDHSSDSYITEQLLYDAYMVDCRDQSNLTGTAQDPSQAVISCARDGSGTTYILGPADIEGTDVARATSGLETTAQGTTTNRWVVSLEFNETGTQEFANVSQRLLGFRDAARAASGTDGTQNQANAQAQVLAQKAQFAIVLDGLTLMASGFSQDVTAPITDGRVQISGNFTQSDAATLANQLSFGSLPLTFTVQSEQQISATLGIEQLRNGLIAGLVGFVLIIIYLLWQYRGLAIVAVASLLVAALMTYLAIAFLSWGMGYRLSLAGVAGLIISIGITVDSFIIYFERIRDEVRHGRTLRAALDEGWAQARRTIIVSDAVNLVAAVVLYFLAVGGVQGFAFTLGVTTIVDLLVIVYFTHPMMSWIIRLPFFGQGHKLSGLDPEHVGAKNASTYGKGRQALADGVVAAAQDGVPLALRRKQEASEASKGED